MSNAARELPEPARTAATRVSDALAEAILSGALAAGAALPPEPELAARFGVSRLTVREAVKSLAARGLVRVRRGEGTRVLDFRSEGGLDLLADLIAARGEGGFALLREAMELRRIIAVETAALACERAGRRGVRGLRDAIARQRARAGDPAAFARGDIEFSRALVEAAGNLPLLLLFNALARLATARPELLEAATLEPEETLRLYEGAVALVEAGDAEAAREGTRRFLEAIDKKTLARLRAARKGRKA